MDRELASPLQRRQAVLANRLSTPPPAQVADTAPYELLLTGYDMDHLVTYLRLLDADAEGADWREVAATVLELDVAKDPKAVVLLIGHGAGGTGHPLFVGSVQTVAGVAAGFAIGVVASLLGVAGGELWIPMVILLFGVDVKLAGSLSLAVSLPTMLVGFAHLPGRR